MEVGTKELKNRLSHYLRRVRAGEVVHVADRGRVVAELRAKQPATKGDSLVLETLESEGLATVGAGKPHDFSPVRVKSRLRTSRIIIEERR